ncbi:MAG: hypothetical protein ABI462_08555 [Ignavibacteria bacterium]
MIKDQISITKICYVLNKKIFTAIRLKDKKVEELGLHTECEFGQMRSIDKKIYRCLPADNTGWAWYKTNEEN